MTSSNITPTRKTISRKSYGGGSGSSKNADTEYTPPKDFGNNDTRHPRMTRSFNRSDNAIRKSIERSRFDISSMDYSGHDGTRSPLDLIDSDIEESRHEPTVSTAKKSPILPNGKHLIRGASFGGDSPQFHTAMTFEKESRKEPTGPSTYEGFGELPGQDHSSGRNGIDITETASTFGSPKSEQHKLENTSKAFTVSRSSSWTSLQSSKRMSSDQSNDPIKRARTTYTVPLNREEPKLSEEPVGHSENQWNEFQRQRQGIVGGVRAGSSTTFVDAGQASATNIDNNQAQPSVSTQLQHSEPGSHTIGSGGAEANSSSSLAPAAAAPVVNIASTPTEAARGPTRPKIYFEIIEAFRPVVARIRWSTSGSFSDKTVDTVFRDVARLTRRGEAQIIEFELTTSLERPRYEVNRGNQDEFEIMCRDFSQAIKRDLKRPDGKPEFILSLIPDFAVNNISKDLHNEEEELGDMDFRL